ncbi:MAG: hypothetical protein ACKO23_02360 [Gemmataceae bacterium]
MGDGHAELLTALRSLVGKPCERSLATNSLKLRFDGAPGEKGRAYIWIDPPWRLSLAGRFITGSADWPVWDGVEAYGRQGRLEGPGGGGLGHNEISRLRL